MTSPTRSDGHFSLCATSLTQTRFIYRADRPHLCSRSDSKGGSRPDLAYLGLAPVMFANQAPSSRCSSTISRIGAIAAPEGTVEWGSVSDRTKQAPPPGLSQPHLGPKVVRGARQILGFSSRPSEPEALTYAHRPGTTTLRSLLHNR